MFDPNPIAAVPQFKGLPRKLDIRDHAGKLYVDELRDRQNLRLAISLDGVELSDVLAYDQDKGVVEQAIIGPLGQHAQPAIKRGRVTVTLKQIEKPKPTPSPWDWVWTRGIPYTADPTGATTVGVGPDLLEEAMKKLTQEIENAVIGGYKWTAKPDPTPRHGLVSGGGDLSDGRDLPQLGVEYTASVVIDADHAFVEDVEDEEIDHDWLIETAGREAARPHVEPNYIRDQDGRFVPNPALPPFESKVVNPDYLPPIRRRFSGGKVQMIDGGVWKTVGEVKPAIGERVRGTLHKALFGDGPDTGLDD